MERKVKYTAVYLDYGVHDTFDYEEEILSTEKKYIGSMESSLIPSESMHIEIEGEDYEISHTVICNNDILKCYALPKRIIVNEEEIEQQENRIIEGCQKMINDKMVEERQKETLFTKLKKALGLS